ncbi:hypothetical protein SDC9_97796 [bioreactor metagenome]|uniref:Uncharacterized protein n=1 Tax=bioreactor metagenome TaxID=1076179 RepID=A0A645AD11_9ZZZZ
MGALSGNLAVDSLLFGRKICAVELEISQAVLIFRNPLRDILDFLL